MSVLIIVDRSGVSYRVDPKAFGAKFWETGGANNEWDITQFPKVESEPLGLTSSLVGMGTLNGTHEIETPKLSATSEDAEDKHSVCRKRCDVPFVGNPSRHGYD
jgi:hypothetical protein